MTEPRCSAIAADSRAGDCTCKVAMVLVLTATIFTSVCEKSVHRKRVAPNPNSAPDKIKKTWKDSEVALRPLVEWFHTVEGLKLSPSRGGKVHPVGPRPENTELGRPTPSAKPGWEASGL